MRDQAYDSQAEHGLVAPPQTVRGRVRVGSWTLGIAAVTVLVALLASGSPLPPAAPFLLLVAALALAISRGALYPNELEVTAEVAVLLCAVVAFRDDAPLVGPLFLAVLVGPLDRVHWEQRAFVRMAYNAGNRGIAILGAAGAFAAVTALLGGGVAEMVVATITAAAVVTAIDTTIGVALVVGLGGSARTAWRVLLDVDALALPLAIAGGALGFVVTGVSWWVAALPLFALTMVPELVQARVRLSTTVTRDVLLGVELVAALAVVACFSQVPDAATVCALAAIAVVVGVELVVDPRVPVPPVLAVVAVGAVLAVGGADGRFAGVLVAGGATAISWWCGGSGGGVGGGGVRGGVGSRLRATSAVVIAAAVGLVGALVTTNDRRSPAEALVLGMLTVVVCTVLSVVPVRRGRRRTELAVVVWTAPLAVVALSAGLAPGQHGPRGAEFSSAALVGVGFGLLAAVVATAAWCGATPWRSRYVSRRLGAVHGPGRRAVFLGAAAFAAGLGVAAVVVGGSTAEVCAASAVVLGESATAMALFATRQWRFAPRARVRDTTVLVLAALVLAFLFTTGLRHGELWAAVVTTLVLAAVAIVGHSSVARSDAAAELVGHP